MRILLVTHRYPPDGRGGVEAVTESLAGELIKAGDVVSVVTRRPAPVPRTTLDYEPSAGGATVYRLTGAVPPQGAFIRGHEQLDRLFTEILLEAAPDLIHIHHLIDLSPRFAELAHRHAALVYSMHDFHAACPQVILRQRSGELCEGPDGGRECARACFAHEGDRAPLRWGLRAAYFRRLLALADRVICPSPYVASFFGKLVRDPGRLRTVGNGIAPLRGGQVLGPVPAAGRLNLAFLGSVVPHKGPHVILEALRQAELGAVGLRFFGQAPKAEYVARLSELAATIPGLRLQFFGAYKAAQLPILLADTDCVVVPSIWPETFSIVTREALSLGIPVLVSRLGALPDAVREGDNGFTFDPARPQELAALLRRLAGDAPLLARLRAGARLSTAVGVAEHAAATRAVYAEALAASADRRTSPADAAEISFLFAGLREVGFGSRDVDY